MLKPVLIAGTLLLAGFSAQAQWVNQPVPLPIPAEIVFQLSAVDASAAWATTLDTDAGEYTKRLVRTSNGGQTWSTLPVSGLGADDYVTSVHGLDANTAWVSVGSGFAPAGGKLLKTTDGGQTWSAAQGVFINNGSLPRQVKFSDATHGIAVGEAINSTSAFEILTTSNGGTSWQQTIANNIPARVASELLISPFPVLQVMGTRAWFATDLGRVYRSSDRGLTWNVSSTGLTGFIANLAFRDANNGLAVDEDGLVARTSNGGLTWTRIVPSGPLHAVSVVAVPGTATYVSVGLIGEPGGAGSSRSTDDGQTWTAIESTINHALVDFVSPTVGWSGGIALDATGNALGNGVNKYTGPTLGTRAATPGQLGYSIYPNPSPDGRFVITAKEARPGTELRVRDALGRELTRRAWQGSTATPFTLDLSQYPAGVYSLEIRSAAGTSYQKLVVQ